MLSFVKSHIPPMKELFTPLALYEPTNRMPGGIFLDDKNSSQSAMLGDSTDEISGFSNEARFTEEEEHAGAKQGQDNSSTAKERPLQQSETFVIVHANPTRKQTHPYDLQVQLVRPNRRGRSTTTSSQTSQTGLTNLKRSPSTQSLRSTRSCMSDVTGSSSQRPMIPLYNFDYHNIRNTVVLDAGTDQQLAKFTRKDVEIDGLGTMHPYEIGFMQEDDMMLGLQDSGRESPPPRESVETQRTAVENEEHTEHGFMRRMRRLHKSLKVKSRSPSKSSRSQQNPVNLPKVLRVNSRQNYSNVLHAMVTSYNPHITPCAGVSNGKISTSYVWGIKEFTRKVPDNEVLPHHEHPILKSQFKTREEAEAFKATVAEVVMKRIWMQFSHAARHGQPVQRPPALNDICVWFEWVRGWNGGAENEHNVYDPAMHGPLASGTSPEKCAHTIHQQSASASGSPSTSASASPSVAPQSDAGMKAPAEMAANCLGVPQGVGQVSQMQEPKHDEADKSSIPSSASISSSTHEKEDVTNLPWTFYLVLNGDARIPLGRLVPAPFHPQIACELQLPSPLPGLRCVPLGADKKGFSREELRDIVAVTALHLTIREGLGCVSESN